MANISNNVETASTTPISGELILAAGKKRDRITLISELSAGNAVGVATVLMNQGKTAEEIATYAKTFSLAVKEYKTVLKNQADAKKKADEDREQKRKDKEAQDKALADIKAEGETLAKKTFLDLMLAKGITPEAAQNLVSKMKFSGVGTGTHGSSAPKQRVTVKYKGEEMVVAVTGNNPNKVKEAIADAGLTEDRAKFIETYKI